MGDRFDAGKGPFYDPDDDKELLLSLNGPVASREFMKRNLESVFKLCVPFIEEHYALLSITEASMSLRAL